MKSFTMMAGLCALLMAGCVSQPSTAIDGENNCEPTDAQCGDVAPANSAAEILFDDLGNPPVDFSQDFFSRKEYAYDNRKPAGKCPHKSASGTKQDRQDR